LNVIPLPLYLVLKLTVFFFKSVAIALILNT